MSRLQSKIIMMWYHRSFIYNVMRYLGTTQNQQHFKEASSKSSVCESNALKICFPDFVSQISDDYLIPAILRSIGQTVGLDVGVLPAINLR